MIAFWTILLLHSVTYVPVIADSYFQDTLPVPPPNPKMLFYLQRNLDRNTLIYEINMSEDGKVNQASPVNIYWIKDKTGERTPLTVAQKKLSYGVRSRPVNPEKSSFRINLIAYKKMDIHLIHSETRNKYLAIVYLDGKPVVISRVFVNITGGAPLSPRVEYIQVTGTDLKNGMQVMEKLRP
jgi:hypothetical protein